MLVESTRTNTAVVHSSPDVASAIRKAARVTGTDFQYLLATAQIESNLNPKLKSRSSSATGLFQFIEQTWLATIKQAGTNFGYDTYAAAISKTGAGRYFVRDPAMRSAIMNLRNDPAANALMAGAFTQRNAMRLTGKIGRAPADGELYIAHFLGTGGAAKLITANASNPDAKAAHLFRRAAGANNSIFYDKKGGARTVANVYGLLVQKLQVARARVAPAPTQVAQTTAIPAKIAAPLKIVVAALAPPAEAFTAGRSTLPVFGPEPLPPAIAPSDNAGQSVFHNLFREGREPVSQTVSELWTGRGTAPVAKTPPIQTTPRTSRRS